MLALARFYKKVLRLDSVDKTTRNDGSISFIIIAFSVRYVRYIRRVLCEVHEQENPPQPRLRSPEKAF